MNTQFSKIGQFSQWLKAAFLRQFSELQAQEKLPSAAFPHPVKTVPPASAGDAVAVKSNAAASSVEVEPVPKEIVLHAPVVPMVSVAPVAVVKPPVSQSPVPQPSVLQASAPQPPASQPHGEVVSSVASKLGGAAVVPSSVTSLSVTTDETGGTAPTSAKTMSFTVTGAKAGAAVSIYADAPIFGGMHTFLLGSGKSDAHGVVSIDTSKFNNTYVNFQARQTVDGTSGPMVAVKDAAGKIFSGMNWDHGQPWVDLAVPGRDAHPYAGQPFNVSFTFNKAPAKFDEHNVIVTGGTLSNVRALDSGGLVYVGSFKASSDYAGTVSFQVKDASYTDVAGNVGWGSRTLSLDLEHKGILQIAGGSGRDGAVQAGDVLSASVIDFDGVDPGRAVAYTWRWTDEHGKLLKSGTSGGDTYTVRAEDVGQHLSVQAAYVDRFNVTEDVSWVSPLAITRSNHPGVATILVDGHASRDGSLRPGDHLTVKVQDADGVDAQAIQYQWVASAASGDTYLVSISMGGKVLAFNTFAAGDFSLSTAANVLAPGLYKDLTINVTDVTTGVNSGQTTSVQNQALGWFWTAQSLGNTSGGAGNDVMTLGATANGAKTLIQTGLGNDTLVLGAFGAKDAGKLAATVTDFTVGQDKISVFGQAITAANFSQYVTASAASNTSTKLVVDLNGPSSGSQVYTLYLQNVAYKPEIVHTLFGV